MSIPNHTAQPSCAQCSCIPDPSIGGTPEALMLINPKEPRRLSVDALGCAIDRAKGILHLVLSNGESERGFQSRHDLIINSLWAVEGILDQMAMMIDHAGGPVGQEGNGHA